MFFREAKPKDIAQMHEVRLAVQGNSSDSSDTVVPKIDYSVILDKRGKGWVCEIDDKVAGFAMVDLQENSVCDLYVMPDLEGKFIGRMLHDMMTTWCFARDIPTLWLTVKPGTRAEKFFTHAGWLKIGTEPNGELKFELENNLDPSTF